MTNTGFKQTEIGEWEVCRLVDFVAEKKFEDGNWIVSEFIQPSGDFRLIQLGDIGEGNFLDRTNRFISQKTFYQLSCTEIFAGDLLVSRMADPIARACILPEIGTRAITAVDVTIVRPKEISSKKFLLYLFNSNIVKRQATELATGTGRTRISRRNLESITVPKPPLAEQQKIAAVLTTVDDAIEKTNEIIEQSKQVKKGLMQDLLMRGIGHKKFKPTDLGELPEEWELKQLSDLCENLDYMRKPITKSKRVKGDVPYYGAMGVQDHVSGYLFNEDLVLVAEDCGGYQSFGQTAYTISGKSWVNNHAHILRCKEIDWIFLKEVLNFLDITRFINTGNRQKLNKSVLEKLPIPVPSKEEQRKIVTVLTAADAKIESEIQKRGQFETLKKGLMQDLLTGRVRFPEFIKEVGA